MSRDAQCSDLRHRACRMARVSDAMRPVFVTRAEKNEVTGIALGAASAMERAAHTIEVLRAEIDDCETKVEGLRREVHDLREENDRMRELLADLDGMPPRVRIEV